MRRESRTGRGVGVAEMCLRLHINHRPVRSGSAVRMASALLVLSAGLLLSGLVLAADRRGSDDLFVSEGPEPKRITVIVNKSRTFSVGRPFARAIVGSVGFAARLP